MTNTISAYRLSMTGAVAASLFLLASCSSGVQQVPSGSVGYSATPRAVQQAPRLHIQRSAGVLSVQGELGSMVEREEVLTRLAKIFPGSISGENLDVGSRNPADWIDNVLAIAQNMAIIGDFSVRVAGEDLFLNGSVGSEDEANLYIQDAYALIGGQLIIRSEFYSQSVATGQTGSDDSQPLKLSEQSVSETNDALLSEQKIDPATPSLDDVPLARLDQVQELETEAQQLTQLDKQRLALIYGEESPEANPPSVDSLANEPRIAALMPAPAQTEQMQVELSEQAADAGCSTGAKPGSCAELNGYLKNVRFYGRSGKLTQRARTSLQQLAGILRENPDRKLAVLAYSSNAGAPWEQKDRARQRAKSVVTFLVNEGVELDRLQGYALGHVNGSSDQIMIKEMQ